MGDLRCTTWELANAMGNSTGRDAKDGFTQQKTFNFGYKIEVYRGKDLVAMAEVADNKRKFTDKFILSEKFRMDVTIKPGQDNLAVSEFVGFIADLEQAALLQRIVR